MIGAGGLLAYQVAGKAVRDGFFLSQFPVSDLPKMVSVAALASIICAVLFSRTVQRFSPGILVPVILLGSGLLHLGEWFIVDWKPAIALVYLHIVGLGSIFLSGFWLLISETFNPRDARLRIGRISAAGTGGGILGGAAAAQTVEWLGPQALLLCLGALHLCCAVVCWKLRARGQQEYRDAPQATAAESFVRSPLLGRLAALVFLTSTTAALLDYLFKSGAAAAIGRGSSLVHYFAVYYTGVQIVTFLIQIGLTRRVLEPFGVARTAAILPVAAGASSIAAILVPIFGVTVASRLVEACLRGSLFRSAYELLYTPIPLADKRAAKATIDVGCDRLGDAAGAGIAALCGAWLATSPRMGMLGLAIALSAAAAVVAIRAGRGYRAVLERGLLDRADAEGMAAGDYLAESVFESVPVVAPQKVRVEEPSDPLPVAVKVRDPVLDALEELRCGKPERVIAFLNSAPWDPLFGAQAIQLIGWDEVSTAARNYLKKGGASPVGQLTDALLDADVEFGIRRRIPRVLAHAGGQRSVDGLLLALRDSRFEVRFQCGRALDYLHGDEPGLDISAAAVYGSVERELSASKEIWRSWRVLDKRESSDSFSFLDDVLRERADHRLEHVFGLLSLVLPREPLIAAFRGLHSEDRTFRALALEYLETLLPASLRERLGFVLEESPIEPPH